MLYHHLTYMLIIEDDIILTRTLIRWIVHYWPRMQIKYVHTFFDAQEIITEQEFDLYLIDMNLPDGFGSDLLSQLPQTSVCIGMSENNVEQTIERQFTAFFHKPFKFSDLIPYLPVNGSNRIPEIRNSMNGI